MLDLAAAVVGEAPAGSVFTLSEILMKIRDAAPHLARIMHGRLANVA